MGFFSKKNSPIAILPDEIKTVESIFIRLIHYYGIDFLRQRNTINITKEYFPLSYAAGKIDAETILQDVVLLLGLDNCQVDIETFEDLKSQIWSETSPLGTYRESSSELGWLK